MVIEKSEGWGFPDRSDQAHYFRTGSYKSLCGGWMYTLPRDPDDGFRSDLDCPACIGKLVVQAAEMSELAGTTSMERF